MIDLSVIAQSIIEGAVQGLAAGARLVAEVARDKAPVRHMFANTAYHIRPKSIGEIHADVALRASLGLGPERQSGPHRARTTLGKPVPGGGHSAQYMPPRHWDLRQTRIASQLLVAYEAEMGARRRGYAPMKTMLDRRGAYEVRTKRAEHFIRGVSHIGGTLRDSIAAEPPKLEGSLAEAWVIASAPYAKYQEFGTRHNAAHPFLRPAAEESRAEVVGLIADAVQAASRTGASSTEIEIVVRI